MRGVDSHRVAFLRDWQPIQVARGAAADVQAVREVVRVVLGALELVVLRHPLHRRVLVRARQREGVNVAVRADENDLRRAVL